MPSSPSECDPSKGYPPQSHDEVGIEILDGFKNIRDFVACSDLSSVLLGDREQDLKWLEAICTGLRHQPYVVVARQAGSVVGLLPLALVKSWMFGRYLVSLPYVNTAGVQAIDGRVANLLINEAKHLADRLDVRHLELRHETEFANENLGSTLRSKVHMRLDLPNTSDALWDQFKSKVRNKVKKGDNQGFVIRWGGEELLPEFYDVFSHTMRDLGTPVFGKHLFHQILSNFADSAELCVVRAAQTPVATALLIHGRRSTLVPSAASLHEFNSTNVNDWMYWQLLQRAIERGQEVFDFGRCTPDGNTFAFKKKWGAEPEPAIWQYYVREGNVTDLRPEGGKYDKAVKAWKRLPLPISRLIGPSIVRGIP